MLTCVRGGPLGALGTCSRARHRYVGSSTAGDTVHEVFDGCLAATRESLSAGPGAGNPVTFGRQPDGVPLRETLCDVPDEGRPLRYLEDMVAQREIECTAAQDTGLRRRDTLTTAADTLPWSLGQPESLPEVVGPTAVVRS